MEVARYVDDDGDFFIHTTLFDEHNTESSFTVGGLVVTKGPELSSSTIFIASFRITPSGVGVWGQVGMLGRQSFLWRHARSTSLFLLRDSPFIRASCSLNHLCIISDFGIGTSKLSPGFRCHLGRYKPAADRRCVRSNHNIDCSCSAGKQGDSHRYTYRRWLVRVSTSPW